MLLFLGDSITNWWDKKIYQRDFSKYNNLNLGIAVYTTKDLINNLHFGMINHLNPSLIVLLIGVNNLGKLNDSPEIIANDIKYIIDILLFKFPITKIILRGLLPFGKYKNQYTRIHNERVNNIIINFANNINIFYIDNSKEFIDGDESIIDNLMPDYLHLSKKGYEILSKTLTPYIYKIMDGF